MAREDNWRLGDLGSSIFRIGLVIGILGLAASAFLGLFQEGNEGRFYHAWLVNFCFFLSLSLGALFFVIIQHLTGATWSVVVRRIAESVAANIWLVFLFFVPVVIGMDQLYPWSVPAFVEAHPLVKAKEAFLNPQFFFIRTALYFAIWIGLSQYFLRKSMAQDDDGSISTTLKMERASAPAALLFALTLTFASFDYLMSLSPEWFSTIFGVYYFSGSLLSFFALLPIIVIFLQSKGRIQHAVTIEHFHDMGKWLFGFTVFWAYIGFSQYFLIWYANLPEETGWYFVRKHGGWDTISWIMLFGHFLIPFFGLLPRWVKIWRPTLAFWSIYILAMHWLDIFWIAVPAWSPDRVPWSVLDLTCFLGMGGIFLAVIAHRLRDRSLVPVRDPRLSGSLTFENV